MFFGDLLILAIAQHMALFVQYGDPNGLASRLQRLSQLIGHLSRIFQSLRLCGQHRQGRVQLLGKLLFILSLHQKCCRQKGGTKPHYNDSDVAQHHPLPHSAAPLLYFSRNV